MIYCAQQARGGNINDEVNQILSLKLDNIFLELSTAVSCEDMMSGVMVAYGFREVMRRGYAG